MYCVFQHLGQLLSVHLTQLFSFSIKCSLCMFVRERGCDTILPEICVKFYVFLAYKKVNYRIALVKWSRNELGQTTFYC